MAARLLRISFLAWSCFCVTLTTSSAHGDDVELVGAFSTTPGKEPRQPGTLLRGSQANQFLKIKSDKAEIAPQEKPRKIVLSGMIRDTSEIYPSVWATLSDLSCRYDTSIHIIAANDPTSTATKKASDFCAPFHLELQDSLIPQEHLPKNRVHRLGRIRDVQRERVQKLFFSDESSNTDEDYYSESVIILVDLDLLELPSANDIKERVKLIVDNQNQEDQFQLDGICASGNIVKVTEYAPDTHCMTLKLVWNEALKKPMPKMEPKPCVDHQETTDVYYDTFATVFWPNTFAYPPGGRLYPEGIPGENISALEDIKYDLSRYVKSIAASQDQGISLKDSIHTLAPVRSCYSGLALYRASIFLTPQCQYSLELDHDQDSSVISESSKLFMQSQPLDTNGDLEVLRYASQLHGLPCEHVTFHECLHRTVFDRQPHLAVDPNFTTYWKPSEEL